MSPADDAEYPYWHHQPLRKSTGPDVPQPYATSKEMDAAGHDAKLNKELGLDKVFDPLASRNVSPTPGPQTPQPYLPSAYQLWKDLMIPVSEALPVVWPRQLPSMMTSCSMVCPQAHPWR